MEQVDLLGIGSYTELPGGNITIPSGYSSIISTLVATIPEASVLKQHPVKQIHWKYRVEMENLRNDKGYESEEGCDDEDGNGSDGSTKTVKSAAESISSSVQRFVLCIITGLDRPSSLS